MICFFYLTFCDFARSVCRSSDGVLLPGEQKDDATVRCGLNKIILSILSSKKSTTLNENIRNLQCN